MSNLPPVAPDYVALRWWEVVLGSIAIAGTVYVLIWSFALLEAVLGDA